MKVLFYSAKGFEIPYFNKANHNHVDLQYIPDRLTPQTANLSKGFDYVSVFTGDDVSHDVMEQLYVNGVRHIAVRAAGYDNVDLKTATDLGIHVANVPEYSPYSVAEHAVALLLAVNRKITLANNQVHRHDFTVDDLVGFDLHNKTVGIIGTGRIGRITAKILNGFGCHLLGYDVVHDQELVSKYSLKYCELNDLCLNADIISIHTPLTEHTRNILNTKQFSIMKKGVVIINTARGAVVNTDDLLTFLENGIIGAFAADVYEHERGIFFYDHSKTGIRDTMLQALLERDNVLITPHQAFATYEALTNIAETTFYNLLEWKAGLTPENEITKLPKLLHA